MWTLDEIAIEIVDAENNTAEIEVWTPAGRLSIMGEVYRIGRVLHCTGVHVEGLRPGALGRSGLNAIGRKLLLEADVDEIVIEGASRTTGRGEGRAPVRSGSPVRLMLRFEGEVDRPVSVARTLKTYGLSLRKAHDVLNRLAAGEVVPVELWSKSLDKMATDLAELGVAATPLRRPEIDVRTVREHIGLSQAEFAMRFGFELDTIQNWEQGRNNPDSAAQILLKVIETHPEVVDEALRTGRLRQAEAGEGDGSDLRLAGARPLRWKRPSPLTAACLSLRRAPLPFPRPTA